MDGRKNHPNKLQGRADLPLKSPDSSPAPLLQEVKSCINTLAMRIVHVARTETVLGNIGCS
jgi:hypothetical protein